MVSPSSNASRCVSGSGHIIQATPFSRANFWSRACQAANTSLEHNAGEPSEFCRWSEFWIVSVSAWLSFVVRRLLVVIRLFVLLSDIHITFYITAAIVRFHTFPSVSLVVRRFEFAL